MLGRLKDCTPNDLLVGKGRPVGGPVGAKVARQLIRLLPAVGISTAREGTT